MNQAQALEKISFALTSARRHALALPGFPGDLPASLQDAYAVQLMSIERWPDTVGGWKVGGIPEAFRIDDPSDRLAGPIFNASIGKVADGDHVVLPIFDGGGASIEAEFVLRFAHDVLPKSRQYTQAELWELIDKVYVGAELASSPIPAINSIGPPAIISDFGNNAGLLVGPELDEDARQALSSIRVQTIVDDQVAGEASTGEGLQGPLGALKFLVQLCSERGITLTKGTLLSSGAITGVHDVTTTSTSTITFDGIARFDIHYRAMTAMR